MKPDQEVHRSFCQAYADAVLRFVQQGINGDVVFNAEAQRFEAQAVTAEVSASQCEWWVGKDWPGFVGPLSCRIDAQHPQFSAQRLHHEVAFALSKSPTGRRISRILADLDGGL